jgi:hypothetical protein
MRFSLACANLLVALVLCGCAGRSATPTGTPVAHSAGSSTNLNSQKLILTFSEQLNGKVTSVNPNLRFVVLTFSIGRMPDLHQRLNVYREGLKVAELNVTGPQTEENVVADISTGDVAIGDEVRNN